MKTVHVVVGGHALGHLGIRYRRHRLTEFLTHLNDTEEVVWAYQSRWGRSVRPTGWWKRELRTLLGRPKKVQNKLVSAAVRTELTLRSRPYLPAALHNTWVNHSFGKSLKKADRRVLWYTIPMHEELLDVAPWDCVVYDCSDMWSETHSKTEAVRTQLGASEDIIAARADLLFASSSSLAERLTQRTGKEAHLIENGVDEAAFSATKPHPALADIPHPRFGFVGGLKPGKVALELIDACAERRPDWSWVLVGPKVGTTPAVYQSLGKRKNVFFVGAVSTEEVPSINLGLDVAILAYSESNYTKGVFPLKLWEALATGIPAVGCGLPATLNHKKKGHYYHTAAEVGAYIEACEEALSCSNNPQLQAERVQSAKEHTWLPKLKEMTDITTAYLNDR